METGMISTMRPSTKARCPQCFKPYTIERAQVTVHRPKFECRACQQKFWISNPECFEVDEVVGVAVAQEQTANYFSPESKFEAPEVKTYECPKCGENYSSGTSECGRCGLVFEKYEALAKRKNSGSSIGSARLEDDWDALLRDYQNEARHLRFLDDCHATDQVEFAFGKYQNILETLGDDALAKEMLNKISSRRVESVVSRLPKISFWIPPTLGLWVCASVGIFLIVGGLAMPMLKNLVGIGMALVFFAIGLRYFFNR